MKKIAGLIFLVCSMLSCNKPTEVKFELPSIIGSEMVLQRNTDVNLWGKATPGQKIEITTTWGIKKSVRADKAGKWTLSIPTGEAGGPYDVALQSKDTSIILNDILIGEVWLCSGQSNMEMPLTGWPPTDTILNSKKEIENANFPRIRLFTVPRITSASPLDNCEGEWVACSPETVAGFSATAYFFGRNIYNRLNIPVGLIHSSWGGTPAEAWTRIEDVTQIPAYSHVTDSLQKAKVEFNIMLEWINTLKKDKVNVNNPEFMASLKALDTSFAQPGFNDEAWPALPIPSLWEPNGLPNFDGIVWMRYTFDVPEAMAGKECTLNLGPIDDMDMTYLNGVKIGEIMKPGFWRFERKYTIPKEAIHPGKNTLAVCVFDFQGGGGIYGKDGVQLTSAGGGKIVLDGNWKYMPFAIVMGNKIYYYTNEKSYFQSPKVSYPINQYAPTALYNGMIAPLVPYTLKGAIWYQGESNVGRGYEYRSLFPAMITGWRNVWAQGDFPFYYVQIAPWRYNDEVPSPTAELREAQLMTLSLPNTGMAVTMDIGSLETIHPCYKQEVGRRLALWALAKDYGFDTLEYSGPLYDTIAIQGNSIRVSFMHADGGLVAKGGPLTWFETAGSDQVYYPADASIDGNTVVVSSKQVPQPVAVRYGWSDIAQPNLFNAVGLPASPFRSDSWKRLSE